jgi:hypothetical protein
MSARGREGSARGRAGERARGSRWLSCAVFALSIACGKKDAETPPPNFSNPAAPAQPAPAKFALADFGSLRYLEGVWKGTMPNGNAFYESYHFVNDSTILQGGHTDSTLQTKSDSSRIVFRNGAVIDSGGSSVSNAEKLDSVMVDFRASPSYHFIWTRQGNDAWTATIYSKQAGAERVTTYPMKRIRR